MAFNIRKSIRVGALATSSRKAQAVVFASLAIGASASAQAGENPQYHGQEYEDRAAEEPEKSVEAPAKETRVEWLVARLNDLETRISSLEKIVEYQKSEIALRDELIDAGKIEVDRLNRALSSEHYILRRDGDAQFQTAQVTPELQAEPPPIEDQSIATAERPQSDKAVDQLLLDQGGVLLPRNTLQIEPSLDYTSISSDRVNISGFSIFNAILIGTIRVDDVNRDILTGAVTARYGTGHRTQVDLRVPFVYRNDTETTGIGTGDAMERHTSGYGLGDIGLTIAWQPLAAKGGRPAAILRVQAEYPTGKSAFEIERIAPTENSPERVLVEAPTGSGFYTVSPGVTFVWPIDPVVMFAGGAYNYTFGRRFDEFGFVEPGHGFEFFAGMNMSINERVSMNFSFLDKQRFATVANGVKIPGSGTHDARLSLGASVGISDRASLVISSSTGLTDKSPDFAFSVRLPIVF